MNKNGGGPYPLTVAVRSDFACVPPQWIWKLKSQGLIKLLTFSFDLWGFTESFALRSFSHFIENPYFQETEMMVKQVKRFQWQEPSQLIVIEAKLKKKKYLPPPGGESEQSSHTPAPRWHHILAQPSQIMLHNWLMISNMAYLQSPYFDHTYSVETRRTKASSCRGKSTKSPATWAWQLWLYFLKIY